MDYAIVNNKEQEQFEVRINEELAYLEYRWYGNDLVLMHTFVPDSLGGKGVASALAHYALEYAKEQQLKVIVYCPFVGAYLKKHPEYNTLISKNYTAS